MAKPVHIFVDKRELVGFTNVTIKRAKKDLTGSMTIDLFMGYQPNEQILSSVFRGQEVHAYIGGHLVFTGVIDRRKDQGQPAPEASDSAGTASLNVGANKYSVKLTCRGKTKALVDSSHQHPTGTMLAPTAKEAIEELVAPWGYEVDFAVDDIALNRVRLRDGSRVVHELTRLSERCGFFIYETRDGKLRVIDQPTETTGEALTLGDNILSFSTDQMGDLEKSHVLVKGHLTSNDTWGEAAIIPTLQNVADGTASGFVPLTVKLYGDGNVDLLERRVEFEKNKRLAASKQITIEVFHVQSSNGEPWDISNLHYVEIIPAGVLGLFEIIELNYTITNAKTLSTSLTLAPVPTKRTVGSAVTTLLATLPSALGDQATLGATRAAQLGLGALSAAWASPSLSTVATALIASVTTAHGLLDTLQPRSDIVPPLTLPPGFTGADDNE